LTEPKLPKIFLDRCLENFQLPTALRKAGIDLISHDEYYGKIAGQNIADTEWLALAGNNGWAAFTKDRKILKNKKEKLALFNHKVQCFCLSGGANLPASEMARRFLANLDNIAQACQQPGPFIYAVHRNTIETQEIKIHNN